MNILVCNDGDAVPEGIRRELTAKSTIMVSTKRNKDGVDIPYFDFVGIVIGEDDDMLVVLPKHCRHSSYANSMRDVKLLFNVMMKLNEDPAAGFGPDERNTLESDYPFGAFHRIYDYYREHGLFHGKARSFSPFPPGKINWKKTISQSQYFIFGKEVFPFPIWYSHTLQEDTFLTACMANAIDSTIERFSALLEGFQMTGMEDSGKYISGDEKWIVDRLRSIADRTFRDSTIKLIEELIDFYTHVNSGGKSLVLRYSSFNRCWELLVDFYLKKHFSGMDEKGHLILSPTLSSSDTVKVEYQKIFKGFNGTNKNQELRIDHYAYDLKNDVQYILDEKYYTVNKDFNYKQFAYTILLHDHIIKDTGKSAEKTYSAMIMPAEKFYHKMHYMPVEDYFLHILSKTSEIGDFNISEEYFDVRTLMEEYASEY